jgi:hypothetical protein
LDGTAIIDVKPVLKLPSRAAMAGRPDLVGELWQRHCEPVAARDRVTLG